MTWRSPDTYQPAGLERGTATSTSTTTGTTSSTEAQEARGTIGSQVAVLRDRIAAQGHELAAEFCDDGHSGARLDRPGLDALRDQAEAGMFEAVWCLSPDRLARAYVLPGAHSG